MLRAILLYLSSAAWARRMITGWRFARRAAARFVAGDTLEEAIKTVIRLNRDGLFATLDHLGENVTNLQEADRATEDYQRLLQDLSPDGIQANASVKLTQLGLNVDYERCVENVLAIAHRATELATFVRIDMEDTSTVDKTLSIYRATRDEGLTNVGLVIQAYLYRSEADTCAILSEGARIRLVKGAYKEPPDLAFPKKADVDANFDRLSGIILTYAQEHGAEPVSEGGRTPPVAAIATHDEARISHARRIAAEIGLPRRAMEFQMLFGIRPDLQRSLQAEGYPVRVYVPYGTEWFPYYMRRLAERPANLWFFLSNMFRL